MAWNVIETTAESGPELGTFTEFLRAHVREPELSEAQWELIRVVFDRGQPRRNRLCEELFGTTDPIPEASRSVCAMLKGARVGGTMLWAIYLLWRALTAEVHGLGPGEEAFSLIVCPDLKLARQAFRYCCGVLDDNPELLRRQTARRADSLSVTGRDGRTITIECLPASARGRATRGRTLLDAVMDEACFLRDPDTGLVNDAEIYRSIVVRIRPGGMLAIVSTPWTEQGLLWDLFRRNWGAPGTALAVRAPTLLMRSDANIVTAVAGERERDPDNAAREYDCVPLSGSETSYFDGRAITAAVDSSLILPRVPLAHEIREAAGDFAFVRDSSALCVIHRDHVCYRVGALLEIRPTMAPLAPSAVVARFAAELKPHGCDYLTADSHYRESVNEHLLTHGLSLVLAPEGSKGKADTYAVARGVLHTGLCRLPDDSRFLGQLRDITATATAGGQLSIRQPRHTAGGHGDLVSAWVLAIWQASRRTVTAPLSALPPEERARVSYEAAVDDRLNRLKHRNREY